MIEHLKAEVNKILNLPEDLLDEFWGSLKPLSVKKGELLVREGKCCTNISLVTEGAFYSFYQKDGNEIIEGFCLEGCFLGDYPSFINQIPSQKNFKAIENSNLLAISYQELNKLYEKNPLFERAGRLMAEFLFTQWELKLRDTIFLSPTERYLKIQRSRAEILQRVPQYLIASFLNVTPQYLSKIRRKIISETS